MVTLKTISACAARDGAAQRLVFDYYGDLLFRLAYRYLGDKMAAEDAVANSFIKIFRGIDRADFQEIAGFEAWIRRIVINESLTVLRRKHRLVDLDTVDKKRLVILDEDVLSGLSTQEVLGQIKKLPLGYRTVLNLFAIEGFTHLEISELLGISIGASKSQLSKARAMLRKRMNQLKQYEY